MTDKEKIRAEVERLKESGCESPIVICDTLLSFIDYLQEEPKLLTGKTKLEKITAVADNMPRETLALSPTDNAVSRDLERRMVDAAESLGISQADYNKAIDELIYGKEEPVSKSLVDIETPFGSRDSELIEESIAIPKGCHAVIEGNRVVIRKGEKPVSENLEEESKKYSFCIYLEEVLSDDDKEVLRERLINTFRAGAQWQEQKDKKILEEEGLMIVPDEQFEKMKRSLIKLAEEKEQMMKDAVEGLVVCDELTHYYKDIVMPIPDYLNVGDKVKLIILRRTEYENRRQSSVHSVDG